MSVAKAPAIGDTKKAKNTVPRKALKLNYKMEDLQTQMNVWTKKSVSMIF